MKKPQDDDLGDCPMCEKKFGIKAPLVRTERKMGKPTMRFSANRLIVGCSRHKKGCTYTTIKPISNIIVPLPLINKESQNFDDAFIDAMGAFDREDYETAYKLLLPLAEQGHVDGQRNLGVLYYLGQGVPQDYKEAKKWWELAAEQEDGFSQYSLGLMHFKEAKKWWELAAEQGDVDAQYNLGLMHLGELGGMHDKEEAEKWMRLFKQLLPGRDIIFLCLIPKTINIMIFLKLFIFRKNIGMNETQDSCFPQTYVLFYRIWEKYSVKFCHFRLF